VRILIGIIVAAVILLGGGLVVFGPTLQQRIASMSGPGQGTPVRMEPVSRRDLVETVLAPGEIEPHTKVDISAQVVSEITALPFRDGEFVKKGDVVVRLDDRDLLARLAAAEASHESALANLDSIKASRDRSRSSLDEQLKRREGLLSNLEFAQRNLERKQELHKTGDVTLADLDAAAERVLDIQTQLNAMDTMISGAESSLASAEAQVLQADAAVKQALAEIELAKEGLANTVIESPIDGRVTVLNAEVGETVMTGTMNNPGTVIMTIADLSRMRMIARVDEADVALVEPGQTAEVHLNTYPDDVFHGVVDRIALQRAEALDGTGFFETEISLRLDGREIRSGHVANADIQIKKHDGLVVPSQSVVDREIDALPQELLDNPVVDRTKRVIRVVYRVVNGKTVATPVKVGPSDLTHTLVLEGLSEGDIVVTGPYKELDTLKHDQAVSDITLVKKEGDAAAAANPPPAGGGD
jgi:HlyD family secretion protein